MISIFHGYQFMSINNLIKTYNNLIKTAGDSFDNFVNNTGKLLNSPSTKIIGGISSSIIFCIAIVILLIALKVLL